MYTVPGILEDLPGSEQTVLVDIAYQHGVNSLTDNLRSGHSFTGGAFWNDIVNNNLGAATVDLRNDDLPGSVDYKYRGRLNNDANLLSGG